MSVRSAAPGLALAGIAAAAGLAVHALAPGVPVVLVAVALGILLANTLGTPASADSGLAFASGSLLRLGIVLLGFELVFQETLRLGARGLAVVVAVVLATYFGTLWAGRRLGVSNGLALLVATGFSICGISAIAAVRDVTDADEEEAAYAIALVTICGTLAIVLLPALQGVLGLDDRSYGAWVGASVHDVGQVIATSSAVGGVAVSTAIVVKLTRVLLLGPLLAWIAWSHRRPGVPRRQLAPPLFVLGFLGAALLRSASAVPDGLLDAIADAKVALLAIALFAVGARVEARRLLAVGARPLLLGFASWAIVAAVAYAGVRAVWA
ncbi:MAG: putative sulfate exporter family transporter [Actinobacteria bacterium]|nr:putative sulfate exporter family transporter [Actinomycetota bacterium]